MRRRATSVGRILIPASTGIHITPGGWLHNRRQETSPAPGRRVGKVSNALKKSASTCQGNRPHGPPVREACGDSVSTVVESWDAGAKRTGTMTRAQLSAPPAEKRLKVRAARWCCWLVVAANALGQGSNHQRTATCERFAVAVRSVPSEPRFPAERSASESRRRNAAAPHSHWSSEPRLPPLRNCARTPTSLCGSPS